MGAPWDSEDQNGKQNQILSRGFESAAVVICIHLSVGMRRVCLLLALSGKKNHGASKNMSVRPPNAAEKKNSSRHRLAREGSCYNHQFL